MFPNIRQNFIPKIYKCLNLRYFPGCINSSVTLILSVEKKNQEFFYKRGYSKKCEGRTGTTSYSTSNCDDDRKIDSSKTKLQYKFHPETQAALNNQINAEFNAFYHYLSMAGYFGQVDIALPGCESYFMQMQKEEYDHALIFFNYIKKRGGRINLCPIKSPGEQNWESPLHAFQTALELEISVTDDLVAVHDVAKKHGDLDASDFIVSNFMDNQMKSINEIAKFVTVLSSIGDQGLARFIFDKDLLENYVSNEFNVLQTQNPNCFKKK